MNKKIISTADIRSVQQQQQQLGLQKSSHPLFSISRFEDFPRIAIEHRTRLISQLYQITLKKDCPCKMTYGQTPYDFDEGVMSFFAPKQVNILEPGNILPQSGWLLSIHPDFFKGHELIRKIRTYGFFGYTINEALILSAEEQMIIENILVQIGREANLPADQFSRDVVLSNIDLLLSYCNRYYDRQFFSRKPINNQLLHRFENLLETSIPKADNGLPSVTDLAGQLNISAKYLSDCLKQLTGQTAQQHIHDKLIEKAKEKLSITNLSVSEISFELGFEHSQSFSKLFKKKTNLTPLAFRRSFA